MKVVPFIMIFVLFLLLSGCNAEKNEPFNIQESKAVMTMDQAITEYLENCIIPIPPPTGVKTFAAYDLLGVSENGNEKTVYLLANIRTYGVDPSVGIGPRSASFVPMALILKEENSGFTVIGHRQPGDGSDWWPDVKKIFPEEYHEMILNYHKTGKGQEMAQSIREKVNKYLRAVGLEDTV